jgi:hypothetical protein
LRTTQSVAQEEEALLLAEAILNQSTERLSLTAAMRRAESRNGMKALLSEGVVRRQAGRYEYFHQTYAEFAIALLLARKGEAGHLARLLRALADPHSHLWPVARHLLLQRSTDDRYRDLQAAVPLLTTEGAQIHLLSAQGRQAPDLLEAVARTVHDHNLPLLHSLVPLLADAPESCAETALQISVPLLETIERNSITEATRTVGILLAKADTGLRAQYLSWSLELVAKRRQELPGAVWIKLPEQLIRPVCLTVTDIDVQRFLHQRYLDLGVCAQRVILRAALAADTSASEPLSTLARVMLSVDCPPEMPEQEPVELLRRCWESQAIRVSQGWKSWQDLLEADLPTRWDSAQVRLIREFARDVGIRRDLLATTLSDTPVRFRDRWVNAAKFVADDAPEEALAGLRNLPATLGREAVGSVATLSNHLADRLARTDRQALISSLTRFADIEPRRTWPALIKLAGPEVDLHQNLVASFTRVGRTGSDGTAETAQAADDVWRTVRASALDTWLNVAPGDLLIREQAWFRDMLPAAGGRATQRRAKLEGRLALNDRVAREWLNAHVLNGPSPATASRGMGTVKSAADAAGLSLTRPLVEWLRGLLRTRHTEAARQSALMLLDAAITPDSALVNPARGPGEPAGPEDLVSAVAGTAADRLAVAVDSREDTQLASTLVELIVRLDNLRPLSPEEVRRVVNKMSEPVLGITDRLRQGTTKQSQAEMASDFSRWAATIGPLGLRRLPITETEELVRRVVTGWDSQDLGNRIGRVTAKVLRGVLTKSPTFATWLVDDLWPSTGSGTKLAIAEAVAVYERAVPGHRALTLARRPDCPPDVARQIYRWLRE